MRLYIGNLSYHLGSEDVRGLFDEFGEIESAEVVIDHYTGRSRGFAFVHMASDLEATKAIAELNGFNLHGRPLKVREADPPRNRAAALREPPRDSRNDNWYGGKSW